MKKDLPLLFGKWKPDKFFDFSSGPDNLSHQYEFSFGHVEIQSSNVYDPVRKISGHSMTPPSKYTPEGLFEPKILEVYHDAFAFTQDKTKALSEFIPALKRINLKDYTIFGRTTGFSVTVDHEKIPGGLHDISERNRIAKEVYESVESELMGHFGIVSQEIEPNYLLWIQSGQMKTLDFGNGTFFTAESPIEDMVNAGTMYFRVVSDETGLKNNHAAVVDHFTGHLNSKFSDVLRVYNGRAAHLGLSGDGSAWLIDLSRIEMPKSLRGNYAPMMLPFPTQESVEPKLRD